MAHSTISPPVNISFANTSSDSPSRSVVLAFPKSFECSYLINLSLDNGSTWAIRESTKQQEEIERICHSVTILTDTFFWLAVVLGIPGNLSAVATLATMPKSTGTFYITLLAVLDFNALIIKMIWRFLNTEGVRLGDIGCKMFTATSNFIVTLANWTLVLICLERLVTIRFPLKKPVYFTLKRARYSALCLVACLCPIFLVIFFLYEESPRGHPRPCRTKPDLKELSEAWNQIITILYAALPSILLLLHVGLITWALRLHKKRRESIMGTDRTEKVLLRATASRNAVHTHLVNQRQQLEKLERSVTGMSLMAAIVFIILTLPVCVMMVIPYDRTNDTPIHYARWTLALTVSRAFILMSHALNCYIYFLTCKKFRGHLYSGMMTIFGKICKIRNQSPATSITRIQMTETTPWNNNHI